MEKKKRGTEREKGEGRRIWDLAVQTWDAKGCVGSCPWAQVLNYFAYKLTHLKKMHTSLADAFSLLGKQKHACCLSSPAMKTKCPRAIQEE